ncbi:S9 family peptidase [Neobacillus sp. SM06]|uniref:S9 family peptidase n=1 Tax=Neobacillus sp. SM06 TaxID=3422492 RepID=UPI003D26AF53
MENKGKLKPEDLYELKSLTDPQLSPDGTGVIYVQTYIDQEKKDYVSNLHYINLEDNKTWQWTYGNHRNFSPRWSPDGRRLAFISTRSGLPQLFALSANGGEAKQLTNCKNGVKNFIWSPCGKKVAFSTAIGKEESINDRAVKETEKKELQPLEVDQMKYKSDSGGFLENEKFTHIAILDLETNELKQLTSGRNDVELDSWSPDGNYIAYHADLSEDLDFSFNSNFYFYHVKTKKVQAITSGENDYYQGSWSPDSNYFSFLGSQQEFKNATQSKVWIYEVKTEQLHCFTSDLDAPVGDYVVADFQQGAALPGIVWAEDSQSFYFTVSDHGNTIVYYGNLSGEIYPAIHENQHVYGFSLNKKDHIAICAISTPTLPGELFKVNLQTGEKEQLTHVNDPILAGRTLSKPETFKFQGADGFMVQGWIMKPADFEEGKKYPLVLEIHGGPHAMYANTYMNEFQILAAAGFAVLYANPRGSHGYGQKFVDAVRGDYGGHDYKDLMDALDYALENYHFIDKERLGVTGGSYGGFMTNWIVGHTNRFKAAVTQRSISNWISFYGVSDIGYFFTEWQILSDLKDIEKLWKHSPLAYAEKIETPLLILQSEKDYRCPIEQAEQLFVSLKRQKKPAKFIRFPESNHELSRSGKPELRIKRLGYIRDWFQNYLGS